MTKALPEWLREPFQETLALVEGPLASKPVRGEPGRIIFASAPAAFLHVYRIGVNLNPVVVLDSSLFLLPLGRLRDEYENYGILQVDSLRGRVLRGQVGRPGEEGQGVDRFDEQA